jgi:hypothetical protein
MCYIVGTQDSILYSQQSSEITPEKGNEKRLG